MGTYTRITDEIKDKIVLLTNQGWTQAAIMEQLGISKSSVWRILNERRYEITYDVHRGGRHAKSVHLDIPKNKEDESEFVPISDMIASSLVTLTELVEAESGDGKRKYMLDMAARSIAITIENNSTIIVGLDDIRLLIKELTMISKKAQNLEKNKNVW